MESIVEPTKNLIRLLNQQKQIDLSELNFVHPIELLPMAALITEKELPFKKPSSLQVRSYLANFDFPGGLTTFSALLTRYIPIYKFSAAKNTEQTLRDKSEIISNITRICLELIGSPSGSVSALNLAIGEIIDNIEEHSGARFGWINAQYYPYKKYLDVCILDLGNTILERYAQANMTYANDREALENAIQGVSSKAELIRGSGLPTITNLVTKAFDGEMIIISGSAIAYSNKAKGVLIQKVSSYWKGTIAAFRIPRNLKPFDYTDYIDS